MNIEYYPTWLEQVRQKLLSLTILAHKDKKPYRKSLFTEPLSLDEKSWFVYFEEGLLPWQAVNEDMELPWYENKKHRIL